MERSFALTVLLFAALATGGLIAFARPLDPLDPPLRSGRAEQLFRLRFRPMRRTSISMTGASVAGEEEAGLAEEGAGGKCVAAFFAMAAV